MNDPAEHALPSPAELGLIDPSLLSMPGAPPSTGEREVLPKQGYYWEPPGMSARFYVPPEQKETATGFGPLHNGRAYRPAWTPELLVGAVRKAFEENGGPMSLLNFSRRAEVSLPTIRRNFPGGWFALLRAAKLEPLPVGGRVAFTDDELLADYDRLRTTLGRPPTTSEIGRLGIASYGTYRNRFGTKAELEERHTAWLRERVCGGVAGVD